MLNCSNTTHFLIEFPIFIKTLKSYATLLFQLFAFYSSPALPKKNQIKSH
jgi:hypothetical protein